MSVKDIVTITCFGLEIHRFYIVPIHYTVEMFRFGGKRPAHTICIVQHHVTKVERHHLQPPCLYKMPCAAFS